MRLALKDTFAILYLRWTMLRSAKSKIAIWAGIILIGISVVGTSYAGSAIKKLASNTDESAMVPRTFAITYLESFLRGELGTLVATTLGLAIISVMVAPFTGASSTSLISHYQLVSVRASDRHRFTDSIVAQLFSSISLLQLLTLTAVGSLLTLDEGRVEGILYAWISWPTLIMLSTFFIWLAEYLYRRLGERKRIMLLLATLGAIGIAVLFDPMHGSTVFGIGTGYAFLIQHFHSFPLYVKGIAVLMIAVLFTGLTVLSWMMCRKALSQPEMFRPHQLKARKVSLWRTSNSAFVETVHFLVMQLWRNLEIRKPLIMVTIFGAAMIFFGSTTISIMGTMILIVPLISALSWGANVFGILGNGYIWISSNPKMRKHILWIFAGMQVATALTLFVIMCIPAILAGRADGSVLMGALIGTVATSCIMTRSALNKSVHSPYQYKAGHRGETSLPPAAILSYTFRFSLWAGGYGFIAVASANLQTQAAMLALAIAWSAFRLNRLNKKFLSDRTLQDKIIYTIGTD